MVNRGALDRIIEAGGYIGVDTGSAPEANLIPVPKAVAESLTSGQLGIVDYYKLRNLQADTDMRRSIATGTLPTAAAAVS